MQLVPDTERLTFQGIYQKSDHTLFVLSAAVEVFYRKLTLAVKEYLEED